MKTFDHLSGNHLHIDGAQIYYEVIGGENKPPLLLLHGGFGNIEDFNDLLPDLCPHFRIIGIDSRGQGRSTLGAQPLTYERIQKDVERVLEHLNVASASLLGFSDGGIVAYRLASSGLNIAKMVTIGSRWHRKNAETTRELFLKITGESWRQKFPATYDAYQQLNPAPDFDVLAQSLIQMWLDPKPSGHPNEAVEQIACPLLIVRGDDDHLVSRGAVTELSNLVPGAKLLNIPFAGHAAFSDQKQVFLLLLNQFLQRD